LLNSQRRKMKNKISHEAIEAGPLLKAWIPFRKALGFSSIRTKRDYKRAMSLIDKLVDEIGEIENHPLADLREQHQLSQSDMKNCAPQSRISEVLNGRREIRKVIAKVLAKRYAVCVFV
jgi:HTH-type transcriptional regulator / antitoxin HigA